jgi:hypothetical protein
MEDPPAFRIMARKNDNGFQAEWQAYTAPDGKMCRRVQIVIEIIPGFMHNRGRREKRSSRGLNHRFNDKNGIKRV